MIGVVGQNITVSRPGGVDRYGDPLPATEHVIAGCVLAPVGSDEELAGADRVVTRMTVYAPIDSDVMAIDRVVLQDGTRWQVVGQPAQYRTPFAGLVFSSADGVCVVNIEKVTG